MLCEVSTERTLKLLFEKKKLIQQFNSNAHRDKEQKIEVIKFALSLSHVENKSMLQQTIQLM